MQRWSIICGCSLVVSLALLVSAAPAVMNKTPDKINSETPLIRTKRAEDDSTVDVPKSNSEEETENPKSDEDSAKILEELNDVTNIDASDEGRKDDAAETRPVENLETQDGAAGFSSVGDDENEDASEGETIETGNEDEDGDTENEEQEVAWDGGDAAAEVEREEEEEEADRWDHVSDENPWDFRQSERDRIKMELEEAKRKKRETQNGMMIAENMASSSRRQMARTKRDLESDENDEMAQLFAGVDAAPEDDFETEGEEGDQWGYEPTEDNNDAVPYQQQDDDDDDDVRNGDDTELDLAKELLAEKAAEEARKAVLRYLMGAAGQSRADEPVAIPTAYEVVPDEREEWEGDETDAFDEQRGLVERAPVKRYPYSYEPYGGQWGAFVPGMKRATAEAYDRLYELAEALDRNA